MSTARWRAPGAPAWLRTSLGSTVARRLFLDRAVDFWLGEVDPAWSLTERRARVVSVTRETRDATTFTLDPGARWPGHRAGQYATVDVEVDGARVRRCYSLASGPGERTVAITVKRVAGGRASNFMHDHLRPGAVVGLGDPRGDFVLPAALPARILLLSGGSGITPVMSMLRDLAARDALRDVAFVHCARTRDDVIFRAELEALAARHEGLTLTLSHDDEGGPLDAARLTALVPDAFERDTFLCGPEGMMATFEAAWTRAGASRRLRRERFGAPRAVPAGVAPTTVTLRLSRSDRSHVTDAPGTLLEQLERAGERPAFGCRMGICNTCRCTRRAGAVVDTVTGVVSREPDEEIRLCTSVALTDVDLAL
jgi:ferredoxin-NADP reductase